jgi:hypothetical protein
VTLTTASASNARGPSSRVRDFAASITKRSYPFTRWRLVRKLGRQPGKPIVVFCMSKTASSAVARAMRDVVDRPVFKIHLLSPDAVARAEADYRRTEPSGLPRHIFHARHLMRRMPTVERPWDVVTIVREPIARAASDFFQAGRRSGRLGDAVTTRERFERFAASGSIDRTVEWFERELEATLGIDVYAHPFDPVVGHTTIETPAVRLLVLRQESLDAAGAALGTFLGLQRPLVIDHKNVGARKEYSELYASVLRDARFRRDVIERAYGSRFARHFYSADERRAFADRWAE